MTTFANIYIYNVRPSLMKYHTRLLTLTGDDTGSWTLSRVGTVEERMGVDREIATLEDKLAEIDQWERRVNELNELLRVQNTDSNSDYHNDPLDRNA